MRRFIIVATVAVAAVGCASDTTESVATTTADTTTAAPQQTTSTALSDARSLVFSVEQFGGCGLGYFCQEWMFYSDGHVEAFRIGRSDKEPEPPRTSTIDATLVAAVTAELDGLNLVQLRESLPEGKNTAAYDGIDLVYTYTVADDQDGRFYSAETELLPSVPLFAATMVAIDAADEVIDPLLPTPSD